MSFTPKPLAAAAIAFALAALDAALWPRSLDASNVGSVNDAEARPAGLPRLGIVQRSAGHST